MPNMGTGNWRRNRVPVDTLDDPSTDVANDQPETTLANDINARAESVLRDFYAMQSSMELLLA